jgi:hypothetical protein
MSPRAVADALLVLHAAFILFAVLGGLLAWWKPRLAWLHLPAALWAAAVVTMGWTCPLTPLEQRYRSLAGQSGYDGSFIEHYLLAAIYPPGLTRPLQLLLGLGVVAINAAVYARVLRRPRG